VQNRVTAAFESFRESYWILPMLLGAGAVPLALITVALDERLGPAAFGDVPWIYTRDAQGAREMLSTIASSLINVIGIVFSITLVTLTIASSQFGTRILRNFARDTRNKLVLGSFVGTFLYCLLVLRTITGNSGGSFVPHLSIAIAIVLAVFCLGLLVFFIHHVISMVQSDNVVHMLAKDLNKTVARIYPEEIGAGGDASERLPSVPPDIEQLGLHVKSESTGYLESIDDDRLMQIASANDLVIRVERLPGDFVFEGSVLLIAYPARAAQNCRKDLLETAAIESRRTYVQDIGFAFEQLVLVGVRALSPAMNNQILAMACIDRLCAALVELSRRKIPSRLRMDDRGSLRVVQKTVGYEEVVDLALTLVGEAAAESVTVTVHMLRAISRALAETHVEELRIALLTQADELRTRAIRNSNDEISRKEVEAAHASLRSISRAA
jgi:uncharacterized membrane protein